MNKPMPPNLTKICANCGQQKPLTAFLEMSGTQGTSYGNICSACRKTALEAQEKRRKTEAEGSTTSETGHKIDTKTKVHHEIDKREQHHRIEEKYHEERKLDAEVTEGKIEQKLQIEKGEKKHRESFLQKPVLKPADKKETARQQGAAIQTKETLQNEQVAQQKQGVHEELKKTEHDFTVAHQGQQIAGQIRFSGQTYQQFRQWLGNSAPIVNNLNQTEKKPAPKQSGAITQPAHQVKDSKAREPAKDEATEYIEKNWRPGSKR